jgi:hypothetical protein
MIKFRSGLRWRLKIKLTGQPLFDTAGPHIKWINDNPMCEAVAAEAGNPMVKHRAPIVRRRRSPRKYANI